MTTPHADLTEELGRDFTRACTALGEARRRLDRDDTEAHREAVAECRRRVDAVLDLYLELPHAGDAGVTPPRQPADTAGTCPAR